MNRLIIFYFILCQHCFCQAQYQVSEAVLRVGLSQGFQKFDQFSSVRIQMDKNKSVFALNLGLSPQKASQNIFTPAFAVDYAQLWKIHRVSVGPVIVFSADSHVFGTRFTYFHTSLGYRFVLGNQWQFFQETSFGPTIETFTYWDQKNQQFTWNYHVKFGLQYALR